MGIRPLKRMHLSWEGHESPINEELHAECYNGKTFSI